MNTSVPFSVSSFSPFYVIVQPEIVSHFIFLKMLCFFSLFPLLWQLRCSGTLLYLFPQLYSLRCLLFFLSCCAALLSSTFSNSQSSLPSTSISDFCSSLHQSILSHFDSFQNIFLRSALHSFKINLALGGFIAEYEQHWNHTSLTSFEISSNS